jgi:hypothetical protein
LSSFSQNVLKFYQQLTGEERRMPFIFDDFHFCRSRVIGLDMTENRIFTLCRMITNNSKMGNQIYFKIAGQVDLAVLIIVTPCQISDIMNSF